MSTYLDSSGHVRPALAADVAFVATCADIVIICHIDIKDQLTLHGAKPLGRVFVGLATLWVDVVHWADINFGGAAVDDCLLQRGAVLVGS